MGGLGSRVLASLRGSTTIHPPAVAPPLASPHEEPHETARLDEEVQRARRAVGIEYQQAVGIDRLGCDLMPAVFKWILDAATLTRCSQACRGLRVIANTDRLWGALLHQHWPGRQWTPGMNLGCRASFKLRHLTLQRPFSLRSVPRAATYVFSVEIEATGCGDRGTGNSSLWFEGSQVVQFIRPPGVEQWCDDAWGGAAVPQVQIEVNRGSFSLTDLEGLARECLSGEFSGRDLQITVMVSQPTVGRMACLCRQVRCTQELLPEALAFDDIPTYRWDVQQPESSGFGMGVMMNLEVLDGARFKIGTVDISFDRLCTDDFEPVEHLGFLWHALETVPFNWISA